MMALVEFLGNFRTFLKAPLRKEFRKEGWDAFNLIGGFPRVF